MIRQSATITGLAGVGLPLVASELLGSPHSVRVTLQNAHHASIEVKVPPSLAADMRIGDAFKVYIVPVDEAVTLVPTSIVDAMDDALNQINSRAHGASFGMAADIESQVTVVRAFVDELAAP